MRIAQLAALVATMAVAAACGADAAQDGSPTPQSTATATTPQATPAPSTIQPEAYPQARTITVQATADVLGREIAYLSLSFYVQAADVRSALDRAENINATVRDVLDGLGFVEAHDESISAYPPYNSPYYNSPATAYRSISVEVPNSSDLSHAIGVADERIRGLLASAESLNFFVTFEIEEGGPGLSQARSRALADARAGAEQIAQESGLTLGDVLTVVEGSEVQVSVGAPAYNQPPQAGGGGASALTSPGYYSSQKMQPTVTITVTFAVK